MFKKILVMLLCFFCYVRAHAEDIKELRFYNDVFSEYTWIADDLNVPELKQLLKPEHLAIINGLNKKIKLVERNGNPTMGMDQGLQSTLSIRDQNFPKLQTISKVIQDLFSESRDVFRI